MVIPRGCGLSCSCVVIELLLSLLQMLSGGSVRWFNVKCFAEECYGSFILSSLCLQHTYICMYV